jgi:hypothetical protein
LSKERMIKCNRCQVRVPVDDIENHVSEAHGSDSIAWTAKSLSNTSPPVTGAAYSDWEEHAKELRDD